MRKNIDRNVLKTKTKTIVLSILVLCWKEEITINKLTKEYWVKNRPKHVSHKFMRKYLNGFRYVKTEIINYIGKRSLDDIDFDIASNDVANKLISRLHEEIDNKKPKLRPLEVITTIEEYDYNLKLHNKDAVITNLRREIKNLRNDLLAKNSIVSNFDIMLERPSPKVNPIYLSDKSKRESSAILVLSDWHVGDNIKPERVLFRNEYNQEICIKRANQMCVGFHYILKMLRTNYHIEELVIGILGDMVSGWIHDEQVRNNTMTPPEEVMFATDILEDSIYKLIYDENGDLIFPKVKIVGVTGNHGRTTKKLFHSERARTSFEWMLYHDLKRRVENGKNITFNISTGEFAYEKVQGLNVRFTHGDGFNYRNGVGGISVPLLRKLPRWDSLVKADLTCMGHWHQFLHIFNAGAIVNSSLVGYNEFAMHHGFMLEEPSQTMILIDAKRGMPWTKQLWLDRKAA